MKNDFRQVTILGTALCLMLAGVPVPSLNAQSHQSPDSWEYLVLAAFNSQAENRPAVNHIGLLSEQQDGAYFAAALLEGYPAREAGLKRGDRLLSVDGEPFHPLHSFNVKSASGFRPRKENQSYRLEFSRGMDTQTVEIEAHYEDLFDAYRSATSNSVQQFHAGNKIVGYVHLWALSRTSNDLNFFLSMVRSCGGCDGMILDLRHSYGFLDMEHLDALIGNRNSYAELSATSESTQESYRTLLRSSMDSRVRNDYYRKPIAVLQNGESRGQVELLLYQLNSLSRTLSIGEASAGRLGKIEVGDSADRMPPLSYQDAGDLLVDGQTIEGRGVSPKIAVEFPLRNSLTADPQYEAAVLALLEIM